MIWSNWSAFWNMGGFAFYIWTSYALAALVLCVNILAPLVRRRAVQRQLRVRLAQEESA